MKIEYKQYRITANKINWISAIRISIISGSYEILNTNYSFLSKNLSSSLNYATLA